MQSGLENLQRQTLHNISGHPVPKPGCSNATKLCQYQVQGFSGLRAWCMASHILYKFYNFHVFLSGNTAKTYLCNHMELQQETETDS